MSHWLKILANQVYFSKNSGATWKPLKGNRINNGAVVWTIPSTAATTQGLIKLCWKQPGLPETVCDTSDRSFSINRPPVASAGADQAATVGAEVSLNGSSSTDPDNIPSPLSYQWTQVKGPTVILSGADTVAPRFTPTLAGIYVFQLIVNDGAADSRRDLVRVRVRNP